MFTPDRAPVALGHMSVQSDGIPLLSYAAMVWRRRLLVLVITLLMVVPAVVVSVIQTRQYQAVAQILLSSQKIDENFNIDTGALTDTQVANLIALLTSTEVEAAARAQNRTADVSAVGTANSNLVTISALDTSRQGAASTIDAYIAAFTEYLTRTEQQTLDAAAAQQQNRIARVSEQIASADPAEQVPLREQLASLQDQLGRVEAQKELVTAGVIVVQAPVASAEPVSPTPVRNGLLALVLGLALGISLAILLETMRRRTLLPTPGTEGAPRDVSFEPQGATAVIDRAPPPANPATPAEPQPLRTAPQPGDESPPTPRPRHRAPRPHEPAMTDRLLVSPPQTNGSDLDLRRAQSAPQPVEPRQS